MKEISSLNEATDWLLLYAPERLAKKAYRLDRMKRLMRHLGNPQDAVPVIHVAGTSGKTSTCYFIRALLELSGKKTGLTVSPHITAINERVQINGKPLAEEIFLQYFHEFQTHIEKFDERSSYYELTMALAYWVFMREKVDYAVIETGVGGLLDGSNVVTRTDKVSVIGTIGYDHTDLLGDTLEKIASQKAGILLPGSVVFTIEQTAAVLAVITQAAKSKHADCRIVSHQAEAGLPLFQTGNWSLAMAVYDYICERDGIKKPPQERLDTAKRQTPPGRYEKYQLRGKTVILDGAHNPQKLAALAETLAADGTRQTVVVFALKKAHDKDIDENCAVIAPICQSVIAAPFYVGQDSKHIEGVDPQEIVAAMKHHGVTDAVAAASISAAVDRAFAASADTIVMAGSLYFVSQVRPLLLALQAE